ncbi:trace amine-associated receptor 13c-like [Denticeps clupeoides]|uniref:G-protein coupled receptors family 1 profile domain-containing protein n=1 Tax=Denticeps clupeoides TaxID=299321 RepID=A0AAY4CVH8_9TELE|nr:trace amine-associated receptor 13c-like [Denticeps clupeoides]
MTMGLEDFIRTDGDQFCYPESNSSCAKSIYGHGLKVALYIMFFTGTTVTIFGNLVVIVSIMHFKKLHTPTNMLVMSLGVADLLLGLLVMPFSTVRTVEGCWYLGEGFCSLHSGFDMFLTSASIYHLIFIAIDRYQAICSPLLYTTRVTIRTAWLMIAISWTFASLYGFGLVFSKVNEKDLKETFQSVYCLGSCNLMFNEVFGVLDTSLTFFLPCSVMIGLYAKIFLVAKGHVKKIGEAKHNLQLNGSGTLSQSSERKAAKTLGIVVGAFILCWMPFCTNSVIDPFTDFGTPPVVFDTFVWLGYFNSTLNPIIYGLFYPWFRKSLHLMVTFKIFNAHSSKLNIISS